MVKQEEVATTHIVMWLSWEEIQKKYPNKWVSLGFKNRGYVENSELDVLGVADTFDEINEFDSKHKGGFYKIKQYAMFTTRSTEIMKESKKLVFPIYTAVILK